MVEVRRATTTDAPGIVKVAWAVWRATYAGLIPEEIQEQALTAWYEVERIAQQTTNPRTAFFVAVAGDEVVGFAHLGRRQQAGDVELYRFYVLPEYQGQGLGRQLIVEGIKALQADGPVARVFAQVERDNEIGCRAYRGLGFTAGREYDDELFGYVTPMVEYCLTVK